MIDKPLPENIKITVDMLLKCGGAELQWLQMGMGLMLKAIIAEITEKFLSKEPGDLVTWISRIDRVVQWVPTGNKRSLLTTFPIVGKFAITASKA